MGLPGPTGSRAEALGRGALPTRPRASARTPTSHGGFRIEGVSLLLLVLLCGCGAPLEVAPAGRSVYQEFTAEAFASHVCVLADPALGGRMTGTPGNDRAAEYIVEQFGLAGLSPGGDDGGWFQPFPVSAIRTPASDCLLTYQPDGASGKTLRAAPNVEFSPAAAGTNGAFRAPLVFAGYGLHNHIRHYNDYAGVSARGAVVMVMQGEPHDAAGQSRWALKGKWTHLASLEYKVKEAHRQGAVGVLVVTPPHIAPRHDP